MPTKIEWTHIPGYIGETWNPVTGCVKISPGCANCYAETMLMRFGRSGPFLPGATEHDRAIEFLKAHAERDFITAGRFAMVKCCETLETFTTDDVWALIPPGIEPHEPRAMGLIMRFAESNNWAYPLDQYRPSSRPKAHRGPKRIWRSRVYPTRDALQPSYEESEQEPGTVNRFEGFKRALGPEEYRELYRDIPVERPCEG